MSILERNNFSTMNWLKLDKNRTKLLVEMPDESHWYDLCDTSSVDVKPLPAMDLQKIKDIVSKEFAKEEEIYLKQRQKRNDSDEKWIHEVVQNGTLSDKVAALTLIIQESPVHNLNSLDSLLSLCEKKDQRSNQMAMEALKDIFIHNILPDRKLISFASHIWKQPSMKMTSALLYYYEDQLIPRIYKFVTLLEEQGFKSNIDYFKKFCMDIACDMLINKPEQEAKLLMMLINKLGDPIKTIYTHTIQCIDKIITIHPVMKSVIVKEIRQFISRSTTPSRTIYIAINYLSSMKLTKQDNIVAISLVECYISLFEKSMNRQDKTINKKDKSKNSAPLPSPEYNQKLLASLLHGITRCYPYLDNKQSLIRHIDPLFKITHTENFTTAINALTLISYIALDDTNTNNTNSHNNNNNNNNSHNSHNTTSLVSNDIVTTINTKGTNTTTNNIKNNKSNLNSDKKNINGNTNTSGNTEHTIFQDLVNRFYRALYDILFSDQIMTRGRNTLFFKLLYRAMKYDTSDIRTLAFIKKLCIVSTHCNAAISAGILFLLSEVCHHRPYLLTLLFQTSSLNDDDKINDSKNTPNSTAKSSTNKLTTGTTSDNSKSTHTNHTNNNTNSSSSEHVFDSYDALKREPLYALSSTITHSPSIWEMNLLSHHYHPSVKAFITQFTTSPHFVTFNGDPLHDFSISAFLNRFAYKNPKKLDNLSSNKKKNTNSGEEPVNLEMNEYVSHMNESKKKSSNTEEKTDQELNEMEESLNMDPNNMNIAPDKLFFYKYFIERNQMRNEGISKNRSKRKIKKFLNIESRHDDDDDDVDANNDSRGRDTQRGGEDDEDDEDEVDKYATELAENLMKAHSRQHDPDADDDDDDDDEAEEEEDDMNFDDVDDDDDDDDDDEDGEDYNAYDFEALDGLNEEDDDSEEDNEDEEMSASRGKKQKKRQRKQLQKNNDDDSENDDGFILEEYESDDDDDMVNNTINQYNNNKRTTGGLKKGHSKKTNEMSDFASAEDYEIEVDNIMKQFNKGNKTTTATSTSNTTAASSNISNMNKSNRKRPFNKKLRR